MPAFFEMGRLGRNLTYLFIPFGVDLYPLFPKNFSKNSKFFFEGTFFLTESSVLCLGDQPFTTIYQAPSSKNGSSGTMSGMPPPKSRPNCR